jgi:glycosyltransferase involved in cell wall biosynthesis
MKAIVSTATTYTATLTANEFNDRGVQTTIFSSVPRKYFGALHHDIELRFVPLPLTILGKILNLNFGKSSGYVDTVIYDNLCALRIFECDLFFGRAHFCMNSGVRAKKLGATFALDRACPHVDFQQQLLKEETQKVGQTYVGLPDWLVERQHVEYAEADWIIVPSRYSRDTFPDHLQNKIIVAPMYLRSQNADRGDLRGMTSKGDTFTVGVVGGDPVRKGYLYLLQAWKKLRLPSAKLKLKVGRNFNNYALLKKIAAECENIEFVGYVREMSDFYTGCDLFVLPSIDDGFGMALLEAMSYGVPCITTTNCGASELLQPNREIYIVPPFDADALAEAIEKIYLDPERMAMGRAGQKRVKEMCSGSVCTHYRAAIDPIFKNLPSGSNLTLNARA